MAVNGAPRLAHSDVSRDERFSARAPGGVPNVSLIWIVRDTLGAPPGGAVRGQDPLWRYSFSRVGFQSCRTTLNRELLIFRPPPLYSMRPSFLNLFMKKFTRERVAPIISASVS